LGSAVEGVAVAKPGLIEGRHYTTYIEEIRALKRSGDNEGAARLLLRCIDATEAESRAERWSVAPGYYWELAVVYRKLGRLADEAGVLERYKREALQHGSFGGQFAERLAKVRAKIERAK